MNNQILVNAIRTPDGTILESRHRHDDREYQDTLSKKWYAVDGGTDYIRRLCDVNDYEELSCFYGETPHEVIRELFTWKSYGKHGEIVNGIIIGLKDLKLDHIDAILKTQVHLPMYVINMFIDEIKYRENNNL